MRLAVVLTAGSFLAAGALPAVQNERWASSTGPSMGIAGKPNSDGGAERALHRLDLRGGGLFFGRKKVVVPRFEPPPPYSAPVSTDSAWTDVTVCFTAIARLIWRIVRYLCRLVARLLIRLVYAVVSIFAALIGGGRRCRRASPTTSGVEACGTNAEWFETLGFQPLEERPLGHTHSAVEGRTSQTRCPQTLQRRDESDPPSQCSSQTPNDVYTCETLPDLGIRSRRGVALPEHLWKRRADEAAHEAFQSELGPSASPRVSSEILGTPAKLQVHDRNIRGRCGVALPEHLWKRRADEAMRSAVSQDRDRQVHPPLTKSNEPFTPSKSFFVPSTFGATSGEDESNGHYAGPIASLLSRNSESSVDARVTQMEGERERETNDSQQSERVSLAARLGDICRLLTSPQTPNSSNNGLLFSVKASRSLSIVGIAACSNVYSSGTRADSSDRTLRYQVWIARHTQCASESTQGRESDRQGRDLMPWMLVGEAHLCLSASPGDFSPVPLNLLPGGALTLEENEQVSLCLFSPTSPGAIAFRCVPLSRMQCVARGGLGACVE